MSLYKLTKIQHFIKRKFNKWWSSIPPISTKQTITSRLNSL